MVNESQSKFINLIQVAWTAGKSEPEKLIHGLKVGMAICLVSLFYYMRPLYEGVGGNAMWAVLTVVVVIEYTVGATIFKGLNRLVGTFLAGALAIAVHSLATHFQHKFQPIILQTSVFLLAAAATVSRFLIPSIKERFDYAALIFILTFTFVSISGYRVGKLFQLVHHRLSTTGIGTSICILTTMLFCPVWAGNELHNLIINNMEKIAHSVDGCVSEYFKEDDDATKTESLSHHNLLLGYQCALNSEITEESLANFARWEPGHGSFNFGHPWKEYLKVGASLKNCAYCIEALNANINSGTKPPDILKKHFSKLCLKLSSSSSAVLKELVTVINTMTKSPKIDIIVEGMSDAAQELQYALKALFKQPKLEDYVDSEGETNANPNIIPILEIVRLVTVSSLLIEIAARTEKIAEAVNVLANRAGFRVESDENLKTSQLHQVSGEEKGMKWKILQKV